MENLTKSNGCDFCNKSFEGLPHKCKYCGNVHCATHLLPENHNCVGLKQSKKYFNHVKSTYTNKSSSNHKIYNRDTTKNDYDGYDEMYHPSKTKFNFRFHNPFKNLFSFSLSSEISGALAQFCIALFIGLILNYIYYQNLSLHYLFIGGVQDWFNILIGFMNYGIGGSYDIFYLIINGIFYFYLFSTTIRFVYAIITNLNKKGTIMFLIGIAILLFVIFKYFPNIIY